MGPPKRKGSVRRQVLDLNTRDDSPSRPTWQTKYQHFLPEEGAQQNGDSPAVHSPTTTSNPLSGLLGNYNSDSDSEDTSVKPSNNLNAKVEDFLKEIQSISAEKTNHAQAESPAVSSKGEFFNSSLSAWRLCYDRNTGFYYYWNTDTNEVTWEVPTEVKTANSSTAVEQQESQKQQSHNKQVKTNPEPEIKKKVCKYPWQTGSDSEDEKIEMITSFGPQSGEESDEEQNKKAKRSKKEPIGPHLPADHLPSSINSSKIKLAPDDPEGISENTYETSSLLTHGVQDTGPPGDDSFKSHKETANSKVPALNTKSEPLLNQSKAENSKSNLTDSVSLNECTVKTENSISDVQEPAKTAEQKENENNVTNEDIVDEVIAQIEKETPPDYVDDLKPDNNEEQQISKNLPSASADSQTNSKTSSFALIANYGDDSESEDNSVSEKKKNSVKVHISPSKPLFPIEIPEEKVKPLFPCVAMETPKHNAELKVKESSQDESEPVNKFYNTEADVSDPAAQKAFKRKKRIEFATTIFGPSTSKIKAASPEKEIKFPSTQYNLDPEANEHHGFGFNVNKAADPEKKPNKNYGGIQFVKAETINLSNYAEPKEKSETENENKDAPKSNSSKESVKSEEIEDAATLLKEKVNFLNGGKCEIFPIQQMAIELETLVSAWQLGALNPPYLRRWLNDKCGELIRHEKAAAPPGWTCLWDRKSKRYYYRNTTTKALQWEYPVVDDKVKTKEGDVEGCGDEMDICDTPPHSSPAGPEKHSDEPPSTPPPPIISDVSENNLPQSPTPQPPPPPKISSCLENEPSPKVAKKKRKADNVKINSEAETDGSSCLPSTTISSSENIEAAPPLPPMPPPPPPPPDESPPPLPDSPPPLPLDPDQPLPPGVDEPEYSLYRPPKHSYKKTQPDTAAFSAELMMTYGYGLPVQQVMSSSTQAMTMQMPPIEYHTYMHEPVTNPYLVQSATTSHVIHCPAKKPKPSLTSELVSFYSDLAMLDNSSTDNSNNSQVIAPTPTPTPAPQEPVPPPTPKTVTTTSISTSTTTSSLASSSSSVKNTESVTSNGVNVKKKKKAKATSGLALKKKGVSSLVAKWQQVQQEVRRDFSDDDDDSPSTK